MTVGCGGVGPPSMMISSEDMGILLRCGLMSSAVSRARIIVECVIESYGILSSRSRWPVWFACWRPENNKVRRLVSLVPAQWKQSQV